MNRLFYTKTKFHQLKSYPFTGHFIINLGKRKEIMLTLLIKIVCKNIIPPCMCIKIFFFA